MTSICPGDLCYRDGFPRTHDCRQQRLAD